jgi:hypothetical protein
MCFQPDLVKESLLGLPSGLFESSFLMPIYAGHLRPFDIAHRLAHAIPAAGILQLRKRSLIGSSQAGLVMPAVVGRQPLQSDPFPELGHPPRQRALAHARPGQPAGGKRPPFLPVRWRRPARSFHPLERPFPGIFGPSPRFLGDLQALLPVHLGVIEAQFAVTRAKSLSVSRTTSLIRCPSSSRIRISSASRLPTGVSE